MFVMSAPGRRPYVSELRRENAEATRLRIATAARNLMLERGYAATTMAEVAHAAGVAVQTLYSSCPGGKPALAKLVYDVTLAGDAQPIPLHARPQVQAIIAETDPVRKLELYAEFVLSVFDRISPVHRVLRAAASSPADAGITDFMADAERQRRAGSQGPAADLAGIGALRPGLTVERAADHIYALTSPDTFERLINICGWSVHECRAWLARTLVDTLLAGR
jgi:AcrR family transcriptional regulator